MISIALKNQVHLYSFDTGAFYTDEEHEIDSYCTRLRTEKIRNKEESGVIESVLNGKMTEKMAVRKLNAMKIQDPVFTRERIVALSERAKEINKELAESKANLKETLERNSMIRHVRPEALKPHSIISIFESYLTRSLGLKTDEFTDALVIVRVFFFEIFKDIVAHGFMMGGKKYIFLTASAGQIRTKKAVMIREDLWLKCRDKVMCGLSTERINAAGGCNTNKYLAYLALCNSATDEWTDFDINKSIVVDDMETTVRGLVDHIDSTTFNIERIEKDVKITHTDGCGMVLPRLTNGKNMMVRLPWVKGLLASFQFDEFIKQANEVFGRNCGIVKDIYGVEHDVLAEGIEVIFTKSQFKMNSYYEDWSEYQKYFIEFGCSAGICNVEEDVIENAAINYQMLQTLTDMTDDELTAVAAPTNYKLRHLSTDKKSMLKALGATKGNPNPTPFQECLMLYPELLQDEYSREEIRSMKKSIQKNAWSGKLDIYGKYLFVIPDLYAFCEWLFCGEKNPTGLLANGEVYAELFPNSDKLDCLRSPHLYREHSVRRNVYGDDSKGLCRAWFTKRAIYTSVHDLISKVLQFDNDGDKLLCVADKTIISVAERNMVDIVPLDYDLKKAGASQITSDGVYNGMTAAYTGGNIGPISNTISKIWNDPNPDIDSVKRLCFINNEVIDYAKTLYKSTPPEEVQTVIQAHSNKKLPHFFVYAKNKSAGQVSAANDSTVNRLTKIVPKTRINFNFKAGKFDYRMLMHNPKLIFTPGVERIIREYEHRSRRIRIDPKALDEGANSYSFQFKALREAMFGVNDNEQFVVDSIIYGIFGRSKSIRKRMFWGAFGDIVLQNLKENMELQMNDSMLCTKCLCRFDVNTHKLKCPQCGFQHTHTKEVQCVDCGEVFLVDTRNMSKIRCEKCGSIHRKEYKKIKSRYYRAKVDK